MADLAMPGGPTAKIRRLRNPLRNLRPRLPKRRPRPETQAPKTRPTPRAGVSGRAPWWVRSFTAAGRPIVAVVVLIMCAPGEHHLAKLAGWDERLAWGMAGVLAAYAGIAAAVASNRPKGAPGKRSAVIGAWLSLGAAMAAQPVSHLFVTGHLTAEPRTPVWLVIAVSCVPPLVLGHILHLAATPIAPAPVETSEQPAETGEPTPEPERDDAGPDTTDPATDAAPDPDEAETPDETAEQHDEPDPEQRLLTTREVADRYGVSVSTVRTWKDRGRITPSVTETMLGNLYDPETLPTLPASH